MADELIGINKTDSNASGEQISYWQSFEELYKHPDFIKAHQDEFKEGVSEGIDTNGMSSISRRKFLALLGASAALAGTACSDYRDKGEIIPYNKKPEEITLGKANYYASTCNVCANACGTLIKTREGRPIKIDGNPDHPVSKGKICAQGQASIMNLYDPDRLKSPKKKLDGNFSEYKWKEATDEIVFDLMNAGSREIAIITRKIFSPTAKRVLDDFVSKYPSAKIYSYEQFDNSVRNSAWQKSYPENGTGGSGVFPSIKWNEAEIILSLDGDFLGEIYNRIENNRLFAEKRDVLNKKFNRLYVFEGNMSLTGMTADYRLRLRPDLQLNFVLSLIDALNKKGAGIPLNVSGTSLENFAKENNLSIDTLNLLVTDLLKNKGKSIIYAGDHLPQDVHLAVNLLNNVLGNESLYNFESAPVSVLPLSSAEEIKNLTAKMKAGEVAVAIHIDVNPVYNLPVDLKYSDALAKVGTVISLVELENETTELSNFILPINNQLESWGDAKTRTGFYSLQQPVIAPLYDTRQTEAILLNWISNTSDFNESSYHQYLMSNWEKNIYSQLGLSLEFKRFWYNALHDGIVYSKDQAETGIKFNSASVTGIKPYQASNNFSLFVKESYAVRDGRFANNGWLQELPHPVSKIVWDNYAAISPNTAIDLGLKSNDMVQVTAGNNSLTLPVFIQPGASDNSITIETGYGRKISGTVGTGIGFNANLLLASVGGLSPWLYSDVKVEKLSDTYNLATSQTVYAFNEGHTKDLPAKRGIIKEATVQEYLNNPDIFQNAEKHELESVNPFYDYKGVKWGMSIDMNRCLGCGECIMACNVENNIPVVGKEQVDKGREMHWIRIDRYYSGTHEDPNVNNQVMLCQHCDHAPCENVCPVVATTHSPDGLNQMVYNRCVGTRYCSNNCPYKVRRFNYFNFRDRFRDGFQESPVFALLMNPEVTVRSRGVMEKCTFCIQRISEARADAIRENRKLKGSDVTTACQDACTTNAIHFGDINDVEDKFNNYRNHELGFYVLEDLNIRPNVTYIAKLKNKDREIA